MFNKDALAYLMEQMAPVQTHELNGEFFADRKLHMVDTIRRAEPIQMSTLSSLIDYIKAGFDAHDKMFVHVKSPTCVQLYSELDVERGRETMAEVVALVPDFVFDRYMDNEMFCINLQSKFLDTPDRALLLKVAGTVEAGSITEYGDDGVTQKATVKTGIASKGAAVVPNPVVLAAYRTFIEVDQPDVQYIFRMRQDKNSNTVQCALFESDGGAWMIEAMESIKEYLAESLKDVDGLIVIS